MDISAGCSIGLVILKVLPFKIRPHHPETELTIESTGTFSVSVSRYDLYYRCFCCCTIWLLYHMMESKPASS